MRPNPQPRFPLRRAILFSTVFAAAIPFLILLVGHKMRKEQENAAVLTLTDTLSHIKFPPSIKFVKDSIIIVSNATVEDLMKLTTYLYHVPIVYRNKVFTKKTLSAVINHKATITIILKLLEFNGIVAYYDGKTLYVG